MAEAVKTSDVKIRGKAAEPATRKPRLSPCGRFRRDFCERGLSGLLEGCRTDRAAMKRIGRQNCAILQCLEERSLSSCTQCEARPCVFQDRLDQLCPASSAIARGRAWRLVSLSPSSPGPETENIARARVPDRSVSRLRWYLAALEHFAQAGVKVVSSADLGAKTGVNPSLVRRDLSYFGQFGTPSRGYQVRALHKSIRSVFEVVQERSLAWVGVDRLLADRQVMEQFARHNWQVVAVFDPDATREGEQVAGVTVMTMSALKQVAAARRVDAAVVAVRDEQAQRVANRLVEAGIDALLNLTATPLVVPESVAVQQADIATQLLLLSYRASLRPEGKAT
jgi:redox-sensing transcriptional repressor